ncbi:MAG: hypothetical protein ACYTFG_14425 [Planctomycetota bacterium]|jgi:hypothetical protein
MSKRELLPGFASIILFVAALVSGYILIVELDQEYYGASIVVPGVLSAAGFFLSLVGILLIGRQSAFAYVGVVVNPAVAGLAFTAFLFESHTLHVKRVNERKVVAELWRLRKKQETFLDLSVDRYGVDRFARSFEELRNFDLVDDRLASGEKHGYRFELTSWWISTSMPAWTAKASPVDPGRTGDKFFRTGDHLFIQSSSKDIFKLR